MRFLTLGGLLLLSLTACTPRPSNEGIPREAVAANNRGVGLMGRFDYPGALASFEAALAYDPDHPVLLVNQAIAVLNRQGDGDELLSLDIAERVLTADPNNLRARYVAGLVQLYLGNSEEALVHFQRVTELDPNDADAAFNMGQCLMQLESHEHALEWYRKAVELDPYLRSAYYRAFQSLQRSGRMDEARSWLERFSQLEDNPRARVVEFKYSKMGAKAAVMTVDEVNGIEASVAAPAGAVFTPSEALITDSTDFASAPADTHLSVCDINGDGSLDVYVASEYEGVSNNAVYFLQADHGHPVRATNFPPAEVGQVRAALWGDVNNDGLVDVYFCRRGPNQLWLQTVPQQWQELSAASASDGGDFDTVDGALVDADHDGDLDIFLVNRDGPNELLSNNLDGSFRPLAAQNDLGGSGTASRTVVAADVDHDRDLDLIVLNAEPPHDVYENRLLWEYETAVGWDQFVSAPLIAAVAADLNVDGQVEIYSLDHTGALQRWQPDVDGQWRPEAIRLDGLTPPSSLALCDLDGDGSLDLFGAGASGWWVAAFDDDSLQELQSSTEVLSAWQLAVLDPARGPALIAVEEGVGLQKRSAGPGRFGFLALELSGRQDEADSMRSNASGIGTAVAARVNSRWTALRSLRTDTQPGQSLQPLAVGLGGASRVDFVALDWSDGVYQTELDLIGGELHRLSETQRQLSSCPVLFAWDGEGYRFVSDILGVGGMGYAVGPPGEYAEPRPRESFLLPEGLPKAREGRLHFKLNEPMEELTYLDSAHLVVYDLPPDWSMTLDERMAIADPQATGQPRFYRELVQPEAAVNERGQDVRQEILDADLRAAPLGSLDRRFIGRLESEHVLELRFPKVLNRRGAELILVADGWVEYPYSQTNFAAWQAGAGYHPPTLEARGRDGQWRTVRADFGYPAGMPRQMSLPLRRLPSETRELRLRTNHEVYWDRLAVAYVEVPGAAIHSQHLPLLGAELASVGFPRRSTGSQRVPHYDYDHRVPLWDTRFQSGFYTRFGPVADLVQKADEAVAIFGPGEEIQLDFAVPTTELPAGWRRFYVLELEGWCKDMDLYTRHGETVEPLPGGESRSRHAAALNAVFNTRYMSGRY